jgi:prephenate dehydrogenase
MSETTPKQVVAILGLGLIGGSVGMALRRGSPAPTVIGWDRSPQACAQALERGAVDQAAALASEAVKEAQIVLLAVPVQSVIPLLKEIVMHLKPGAVVTDAGSAKSRIVQEATHIYATGFIGGHPMAGAVESGIGAASPDMFQGAPWILTPTLHTGTETTALVSTLVQRVGAVPRYCDPETHDRWVAALSHLPHLLAYALAQTAFLQVPEEGRACAAGSFRDGARVAKSSPAFWTEIMLDNREALLSSLEIVQEWLQQARIGLENRDSEALHRLLEQAHMAHRQFSLR